MAATSSLLRMEEIEGKGRGLVSLQPLRAGQIILRDSPVLLYSAFPLIKQNSSYYYCDHCFRTMTPLSPQSYSSISVLSCTSCAHNLFCSQKCLSTALKASHSSWVCQALARLRDSGSILLGQPLECQVQARFLIAAYNLAFVSPPDFQILLSLQGSPDAASAAAAQFLHPLISSVFSPTQINPPNECSVELTAALLAKDKLNAFGLMQPFSEDDAQRLVRAYGIYPNASFFNHDCLPNACRFDYVDTSASDDEHNTDFIIRMIHDVPQGREICLSYFPVNENYSSRQRRLLEDYGFNCNCDRCNIEASWSENDEVGDNAEDEEEMMDEDQSEDMMASDTNTNPQGENNDFPHSYFFLRYMCDRKNCWGTLAPLPPKDGIPSNVMECNVCGNLKKDGFDADGERDKSTMED
ncbi:Histone-lysine N-methyltransferase ASHR2 [Quillaja saponaria]|uniref:Histone-lysine N-methyltransferase ASHR2 n=1 Tax=Quillaja saponaria TaxID=32244 RepID=A0AAD7P5J5_QUISA|nr:Histone-lysine N-methyltransferase ASHR2 [Quillaja saponaria]